MTQAVLHSRLGPLTVSEAAGRILALEWRDDPGEGSPLLGATGLGGFSTKGGVETKVWLLKHEGAASLLI